MGEEGQEYEVESVIGARVEKKRGRKQIWKYHVKWKGYGPDENTWEPEESFDSTDFILRFWERARTDGRDYRDLSAFRVGEQFVPMGPPRKLKTFEGKSNTPTPEQDTSELKGSSNESSLKQLGKRPQASMADVLDGQPPAKRTRGQAFVTPSSHKSLRVRQPPLLSPSVPLPRRSSAVKKSPASPNSKSLLSAPPRAQQARKKPPRTISPEFVPDSDEEREISLRDYDKQEHGIQFTEQNKNTMDVQSSSSNSHPTKRPPMDIETEAFDPLFDEVAPPNVPFYQVRAAKPLVKAVDDPNYVNSGQGISVKARLGVATTSDGPKRSKAGPGRSSAGLMLQKNKPSLLTASKGGLKTIKGKYVKPAEKLSLEEESGMDVDNSHVVMNPEPPPTPGQLLQLAGLNEQDATDLPDFEDTVDDPRVTQVVTEHTLQSTLSTEPAEKQVVPALADSLALAKDKLFPAGLATMVSDTVSAAWRRPTIFGPLGLGINPSGRATGTETSESTRLSPFMLPLDNSVSVPVLLTDVLSTNGPSLDFIVGSTGPPGKFYGPEAALTLLNTIRAGGPSARIIMEDRCSDEDKKHFERFCARLHSGDLFVGMAGVDLLAFCSSRALVAQRLNLPEPLLILSDSIVVSRVVVEDYSAYADAVEKADETRWLQYISQ